ncbi:MAG TPA: hypothetical protein PLG49_07140, partial [Defluviitaleaceae bacterium]|nr:hypothetical protein [Defluviitaleaceae bacterium]
LLHQSGDYLSVSIQMHTFLHYYLHANSFFISLLFKMNLSKNKIKASLNFSAYLEKKYGKAKDLPVHTRSLINKRFKKAPYDYSTSALVMLSCRIKFTVCLTNYNICL